VRLFDARRADIERYARHLETLGRARATVARRLCTIAGFYRCATEEGLLAQSPAVHVRRPRLDYESHAAGLDRNELGALLVAAGLAGATAHALVSLFAINGLRVSEALGADIEHLGLERGHRTLTVVRKGGKLITIPLAPRTARAIDLAIGERLEGPIFAERRRPVPPTARPRADRQWLRPPGGDNQAGQPAHLAGRVVTVALDAGVQEAASQAPGRAPAAVAPIAAPTSDNVIGVPRLERDKGGDGARSVDCGPGHARDGARGPLIGRQLVDRRRDWRGLVLAGAWRRRC